MSIQSLTKVEISRDVIEKIPEGWQMDAVIESTMFGKKVELRGKRRVAVINDTDGSADWLSEYSTDMNAAMKVVNLIASQGFGVHMDAEAEGGWMVKITSTSERDRYMPINDLTSWDETLPMAICKSALKLAQYQHEGR